MSRRLRSRFLWFAALAAVAALVVAPQALATGPYTMTVSSAPTSNVVSSGGTFQPTANGANLNVSDLVAALMSGNVVVGGSSSGTITISSSISYSGSNVLAFDSGSGAIDVMGAPTIEAGTVAFAGLVSGASDLTVDGTAQFSQGVSSLGNLRVNGHAFFSGTTSNVASVSVSSTASLQGSITTTGAQTYTAAVTLSGDTTLVAGAGSAQVTFGSTVDGGYGLTVDGDATFDASVGSLTPLHSLSVTNDAAVASTAVYGNVTTSGTQTYTGSVYLDVNSPVFSGTALTFNATIDGASSAQLTGSNVALNGTIGGTTPLNGLQINAANISLGASASTTGGQLYNGAVVLTQDVTAQSTSTSGIVIEFAGSIDGAHALTVNTGNIVKFDGPVGSTTPLARFTVNSLVMLGGGRVATTGDQTYTNQVALTANDTFADGSGSSITFDQLVFDDAMTMSGPGSLQLLASNSQSSSVVNGGTVSFVSGGLGSGPVALDGGTLQWSTGNTSDVSPELTVGAAGGTVDTNGNDIAFAHAVAGSGTLTKTGAGTLSLNAAAGGYGNQLAVSGGTVSVNDTTVTTPVAVQPGGTLTCSGGGTLSGGVTNAGGTLSGAPSAPTVTSATDQNGPTVSVGFTAGTANCLPVSYTAQTTTGGFSSSALSAGPLTVGNLAAGTTYAFTVTATNPMGSAVSGNSMGAATPDAPSISVTSPTQGTRYDYNQTVAAGYTCSDGTGPGISSCNGSIAAGATLDTSKPGDHSFTVTATSADGYTSTRTITYSVAAPPKPLITLSSPTANATYTRYQVVDAGYSCQDATSGTGIATCVGSTASGSPINTSELGRHTFTVTATSSDGATSTATATYTVVRPSDAFTFAGLRATRSGLLRIWLSGLGTPGAVRVTVRVRKLPTLAVNQAAGSKGKLGFTLSIASELRDRESAPRGRVAALVSVTYTPHGGLPLTHSRRVTLTLG